MTSPFPLGIRRRGSSYSEQSLFMRCSGLGTLRQQPCRFGLSSVGGPLAAVRVAPTGSIRDFGFQKQLVIC